MTQCWQGSHSAACVALMEYLQVRTLVGASPTDGLHAHGLHGRRQNFGITPMENDSLILVFFIVSWTLKVDDELRDF
jgi:hypothetical protein